MYAWLWRQLPGPVLFKVILALVLVAVVVVVLFLVVFPWVQEQLPYQDTGVQGGTPPAAPEEGQ